MQKRMIEISFSKVTSVHLINLSGQQKKPAETNLCLSFHIFSNTKFFDRRNFTNFTDV